MLDAVVGRLVGVGPAAHRVWMAPLAGPVTLDQVPAADGPLAVAVGLVDRPREQRRTPLVCDFSGAAGHGLILGGPRSGKSTALASVAAALALGHSPDRVVLHLVAAPGGPLASLSGLPHVAVTAAHRDRERIDRTLAALERALTTADTDPPHRFLLVDDWTALRRADEAAAERVAALAADGLAHRVHVLLSASRPADVHPSLKDLLLTRIELRLGDPLDSDIDHRAARDVPANTPGRGLLPGPLHCLLAIPDPTGGTLDAAVRARHPGAAPAAPVLLLPRLLPADDPRLAHAPGVPLGLEEDELAPVGVDFDADPHLVVLGDPGSGRTGVLRLLARGIAARATPDQAILAVGDLRRTLLGALPPAHTVEHATGPDELRRVAEDLRDCLASRLGARRPPGPAVHLLVDDYELASGPAGGPLDPLLDLLPHARDIGLRLVVARSCGGAGRALYEPLLQRLREAGAAGLLLSGDPEEGALLGGVRPAPLPPGRGRLTAARGGPAAARLVQTAWLERPDPDR
ncbi:hypothetical protein BIV57_21825 [Mangrovactinospora gilvigrisea]|uniref:FtsK domain-containing protein n=1 Tax=Mangrovactinospora gilvigrisea TaxID=1428644 RepID=A0A1J7C6U6_9ACTN|nr:FtsK/SpoIIIE domain-containing protein [Mangrovactinospora gilvigrisea]OIV35370.1 hypothetical protein BIV57_21825 [Mangrovactinospora gilvigrisea]